MGKKKQTIGYWYNLAMHFGWCQGPIDALLQVRGGDRSAWTGRVTESSTITIDAIDLYGGEKKEGGIQGDFDVMMGEATQTPNAYLAATFGSQQSAHRGKATGVFKGGKIGAINPYPKPLSFKLERVFKGWQDDVCWYPEKAAIPISAPTSTPFSGVMNTAVFPYQLYSSWDSTTMLASGVDTSGWPLGGPTFDSVVIAGATLIPTAPNREVVIRFNLPAGTTGMVVTSSRVDDHLYIYINGVGTTGGGAGAVNITIGSALFSTTSENEVVLRLHDIGAGRASLDNLNVSWTGVTTFSDGSGMNPAHILYDSITLRPELGGQGEPIDLINDASFRVAAGTLFDEAFPLCMTWEGDESAEDFQQRVLDIIGGALTQSRVDGQYYLDLIRDDYDFDSLPIVTETDVVDFSDEPTNLSEAINQVIVEWFDQSAKESRATAPTISLGAVQAAGGVISQTFTFREIPVEELALRVAARELRARSVPLSKFTLTLNRRLYALRPAKFFRLQMPSEGIADMVCIAGEVDYGELAAGKMKITAAQAVFGMTDTVYVGGGGGLDNGNDPTPYASPDQLAFEVPYCELAGTLSNAELVAVGEAAGFIGTVAVRPAGTGLNYSIYTAAGSEAYLDRGTGDWCPSALVVEAAGQGGTAFTFTGGSDLDQVAVGTAALWGEEIVRVDSIDTGAGTLTLGRACADTAAAEHTAGTRIYFYDASLGADGREYVDGETVHAKLLTRTSSAIYPIGTAVANSVVMNQRAARPYPPGKVTINGVDARTLNGTTTSVPASGHTTFPVTWAHRDRVLQADTLIDYTASSVGPDATTRYTLRYKRADTNALLVQASGIATTSATVSLAYAGIVIQELYASNDVGDSWQIQSTRITSLGGGTNTITGYTPWVRARTIIDGGVVT